MEMNTIVEYDFYWEIEKFTASINRSLVKKFELPNTGDFDVRVLRADSIHDLDSCYRFSLFSDSLKSMKAQFKVTIQTVENNVLKIPITEIYTLSRNVSQHIVTVRHTNTDLRLRVVNYNHISRISIPVEYDFIIFKCRFKFYILDDPLIQEKTLLPTTSHKKSCNLCSDFKRLYDSKEMSDVTIVIGEESLPAHKLVLVTRSPVFRAMMDNDWLESRTKTLQITDTNLHVFDCFLKYLYSSEIDDKSYDAIRNLYALADKYNVDILKAECRDIFIDEMKINNVCEVLELAQLYTDDVLKQKAVEFMECHFSKVSKMQEWIKICKDKPELASDVLGVLSVSLNKPKQ